MEHIEFSMNEQQLAVTLNGEITSEAVRRLVSEIRLGFDYYKFPQITLRLDSPGGEYKAMKALIDACNAYRAENLSVHVQASQQCASAAALVLAQGHWGTRTVEPDTQLLFHWVRTSFQAGQILTSDLAANLARGLSSTDDKILERLVASMCRGAGNETALIKTIVDRLDELLNNWNATAAGLSEDAPQNCVKSCEWLKELQRNVKRWIALADTTRQKAAVISFLKARFEKDSVMDLREAYALCLIDAVRGVLPAEKYMVIDQPRRKESQSEASHEKNCNR